jgi:hypothetical protein
MKFDRSCGQRRQADQDGFFSGRIESKTHIATLPVQLDGLARGSLFHKLSNPPLAIPDDERAILLDGDIGHRTGKTRVGAKKKKGKYPKFLNETAALLHPTISGKKGGIVEPCSEGLSTSWSGSMNL